MPSVHLESVSFSHGNSVPILEQVSAVFPATWTGVVGPNGGGKSTLLHLIESSLEPDAGCVRWEPRGATVVLCRQTAESLSASIREFADAPDGMAHRLRGRLRLEPVELERWPSLSPGERRRWQIGAALAAEPQVLLLDEPTDHLDGDARELLVAALCRFEGVGVVVSHDRSLLDELTERTLKVEDSRIETFSGAYSAARAGWDARNESLRSARESARRQEKKIRARLQAKREQLSRAESAVSTRRRAKGRKDRDARTMDAKNQARAGASHSAHEVKLLRRQTERASNRSEALRFEKQRGRSLFVDFEPAPVPVLLSHTGELRAGEKCILEDSDLVLRRNDRIWVRGPNGAGKTTLLRGLLQGTRVDPDRILHLPQELGRDPARDILADTRALHSEDRTRVLSLLSALGADPERVLASEDLSPGETRKLALAWGLGRKVWAVVLDEPTNHLDMPAIEHLEAALCEFPGALLLVTHDTSLARICTRDTWDLPEPRGRSNQL